MKIREIREEDAERFLELCKQTDAESKYLLYKKGERSTTVDDQLKSIQSNIASKNSVIYVVEDEGSLAGYLLARGGAAQKNRHSVYLVIAILKSYTGRGIGTELFIRFEKWARARQITRLELGVMKANTHALALYQKMGFEIEGVKKKAFYMDGKYYDEYLMAKLLD